MEPSKHSEHRKDGMGHAMHEGRRETGSKDGDHTGHHAHMAADFRKRSWISLVSTLPILVFSPMLRKLVGLREAIRFPGDFYVLFGFASAVFWYGGGRASVSKSVTKDPSCGMTGDEATTLHAERDGKTFYFCSDHCRQKFLSTAAGAKPEDKSGGCCGSKKRRMRA